jgi:hypothetical protein
VPTAVLDPRTDPCYCVTQHVPNPKRTIDYNGTALCETGLGVVKSHLAAWQKAGRRLAKTGRDNPYLYRIASEAWDAKEG